MSLEDSKLKNFKNFTACGRPSLPPAFSGASPGWTPVSRTASGQDSPPVQTLSGLRGAMFLLNSQDPLVTATCGSRLSPEPQAPLFGGRGGLWRKTVKGRSKEKEGYFEQLTSSPAFRSSS